MCVYFCAKILITTKLFIIIFWTTIDLKGTFARNIPAFDDDADFVKLFVVGEQNSMMKKIESIGQPVFRIYSKMGTLVDIAASVSDSNEDLVAEVVLGNERFSMGPS